MQLNMWPLAALIVVVLILFMAKCDADLAMGMDPTSQTVGTSQKEAVPDAAPDNVPRTADPGDHGTAAVDAA